MRNKSQLAMKIKEKGLGENRKPTIPMKESVYKNY